MATGASPSILTLLLAVLLIVSSLEAPALLLTFVLERRELDGLLRVGDRRGERLS